MRNFLVLFLSAYGSSLSDSCRRPLYNVMVRMENSGISEYWKQFVQAAQFR